jgi:hypothetical protein
MLISFSFIIVLLLIGYMMYLTHKKRKYITSKTGMMISMTTSMMASIVIGMILATILVDSDLPILTIITVSIGMLVGYITGKPLSHMASLDGLLAGIMGGMMSPMLSDMLNPQTINLMIYFFDAVFVLVNILLIRLIQEETKTN